ncbi:LytR family transcriptional regulator, partial [Amycolatopsis sp. SID8362]|nr:LytR family transcriptional regulator [Amycolatopsis sp. SID8362]NED41395.1 LytR family transcriptional regulator [Amycolatopsis sp. SID8362]
MEDEQEKPDAAAEPVTESDDDWKPSPFPRAAPAATPSRARKAGRVTRRVALGLVSL